MVEVVALSKRRAGIVPRMRCHFGLVMERDTYQAQTLGFAGPTPALATNLVPYLNGKGAVL